MSDLSYLETISNKELLAKCLEHGLPGVPVTDTTRAVIIRRLRATILGSPLNKRKTVQGKTAASATKQQATPRRETIHGSKVTPAAENVRRTAGKSPSRIASSSISNNNNNNNSINKQNERSRRTVAYGLDNTSDSGRSVQTTTTVSDVGSQSEDDDYYVVDSPVARYSNLQQTSPDREDPRRSVSLTKSGVLTTSYTREVEQPHYERHEEYIPKSHNYERSPLNTLPSYVPRIVTPSRRPMNLDMAALSRTQNVQTQLNSTSYQEDAGYSQSQPIRAPRNTFSGSAKPFGGAAAPSQPRQSGPTGGFRQPLQPMNAPMNTLYPTLNQFYDQPDNNARPIETDSESEAEEAPQLRSSHLSQTRSSPLARPPLPARQRQGQGQVSPPMVQFRELFRSLDRQYHLKFYFLLCVTVMVATMLYVALTPAV